MQYKLTTGLSVRTGPNDEAGNAPMRRIGEKDDVITAADVLEWNGAIPQWLIDDGLLVPVDSGAASTVAPAAVADESEVS